VTFDDGYADNLYEAKPLLEKYEVPAIVFICTGALGREFWWDELHRRIVSSTADLDGLHLQMRENRFLWEPPSLRPEADSSIRMQTRHSLYHFLLTLDLPDQERAMEVVRHWSGLPPENNPANRTMNQAELLQLANDGLVELGSHTRNHPMLPRLPLERQRDEILSGKQDLEALLNRPVQGFSYPNGRATREAKQIVREAGFAYACTSLPDVVRPGSDLYELTRFWQEDVNGEKFMQGIKLWMALTGNHG
jgi:peptidoglycan/xylan/chitin deacetylase (PgdA/CDA1 family)